MPKFMQEVKVEGLSISPQFLNPTVKAEEITKVGTTGNRLTDIAFNSAIKYSQHMDELKRANELADLKINLNKELQDYELSWKEKDKYSDVNYTEYKSGLSSIYEKNKIAIADSRYTKESDVISWEGSTEQYKSDSLFKVDGEKANYDIKKTTDESILKADSLMSSYIATGDEDIKSQALNLFNGLSAVGIPQHEIDKMKIKTMVDADTKRLDVDINRIINDPNLKLQEKADKIKLLNANIESEATYEAYAKEAVDRGLISKDSADIFKSYSKGVYTDSFLKTGGIIQKLNKEIEAKRDKDIKAYNKNKEDYYKDLLKTQEDFYVNKSGRDVYKGLDALIGQKVNAEWLLDNPSTTYNYTNFTSEDNTNYQKSNKYLQTMSSDYTDALSERLKLAKEDTPDMLGDKVYLELRNLDDRYSTEGLEGDDLIKQDQLKQYTQRQLADEGVIGNTNIYLYNTFNRTNEATGEIKSREILKDYNFGKRVSFDINSMVKGSKGDKQFNKVFTRNDKSVADINVTNTVLNIIQGRINQGKYSDITSDSIISNTTLSSILDNEKIKSDIKNLINEMPNVKYKTYTPIHIKMGNDKGSEFIRNRLKNKYEIYE